MTQIKLIKKLKSFLVLFLILSYSASAIASPPQGKYIQLEEGKQIPWTGWCFDSAAVAEIIANKSLERERCTLVLNEEIEKQKAKFDLKYGKLEAKLDYEVNTKQTAIDALQIENQKLEKTLVNNSKFGWIAPVAIGLLGGFAIGALVFK